MYSIYEVVRVCYGENWTTKVKQHKLYLKKYKNTDDTHECKNGNLTLKTNFVSKMSIGQFRVSPTNKEKKSKGIRNKIEKQLRINNSSDRNAKKQ